MAKHTAEGTKQKKRRICNAFSLLIRATVLLSTPYIFCEVGSGVTIVLAGVVGAEHAATVRARTKPTTTFFIVCPFISLRLNNALRKRAALP